MSSARRIQASRANGALSKGPTTAEGKLRCARNALQRGLRASTIVPNDENSPALLQLFSDLQHQLHPSDRREECLVAGMAFAHWRTLRLWSMEADEFEGEMARQDFDEHDPSTATEHTFRALCDDSRYRQYTRAPELPAARPRAKNTKFPNRPNPKFGHPSNSQARMMRLTPASPARYTDVRPAGGTAPTPVSQALFASFFAGNSPVLNLDLRQWNPNLHCVWVSSRGQGQRYGHGSGLPDLQTVVRELVRPGFHPLHARSVLAGNLAPENGNTPPIPHAIQVASAQMVILKKTRAHD